MSDTERNEPPTDADLEALHVAVGAVLFNASNFPEKVQSRLLGQDMAPLREKIVAAVHAAGFRREPTDGNLEAIRALMGEFTTWEPGTPDEYWSITDHMFLDFEFWKRFTAILDGRA